MRGIFFSKIISAEHSYIYYYQFAIFEATNEKENAV